MTLATAGLVAEARQKAFEIATQRPRFIVTGGNGSRIIKYLDESAMLVPDLVLNGLALWVHEMHKR